MIENNDLSPLWHCQKQKQNAGLESDPVLQ